MKILSFSLLFMFFSLSSFSQNSVTVNNLTGCDLILHTPVYQDASACSSSGSYSNTFLGAGGSLTLTAPPGHEMTYLDGVWPASAPSCFFSNLETDANCTSCSSLWSAPSSITVTTGGCGGCPSSVNMTWTSCNNAIVIQ